MQESFVVQDSSFSAPLTAAGLWGVSSDYVLQTISQAAQAAQAAAAGFSCSHLTLASSAYARGGGSGHGLALQHSAAARQPAAPPGAVAGGVEVAGGGDGGGSGGALRVIDTELRVETEQSYLAVRLM